MGGVGIALANQSQETESWYTVCLRKSRISPCSSCSYQSSASPRRKALHEIIRDRLARRSPSNGERLHHLDARWLPRDRPPATRRIRETSVSETPLSFSGLLAAMAANTNHHMRVVSAMRRRPPRILKDLLIERIPINVYGKGYR
jgi:hypothetical protein